MVDLAVRTDQFVTISVTDQGALDEVPDDYHSLEKLAVSLADQFWIDVGDRRRTISARLQWTQA